MGIAVLISVMVAVIVIAFVLFITTYTVVEPNKAHIVVVLGRGRRVYSPHNDEEEKAKTSYFFVPFLMKRIILPLTNVKMEIPGFELKDSRVAPFMCEVTCWFRIENPDIAVEKLDILEHGFEIAVKDTLEEQVRGIARAAAMKQEVLDIMRDRKTFGGAVEVEVNGALEEWGLELVKLEIIDFLDVENSRVIKDYEDMRQAEISALSRKRVAEQNKDAEITEATNRKLSGIALAESQKEIEKANVNKQKEITLAQKEADKEVAIEEGKANKQKVEAMRVQEVGTAEVTKQAKIKLAEGDAQSEIKKGQADADVTEAKGKSQASVVKNVGLAEAESTDKKAEALKKYNEAGITLEQVKAFKEIEIAKYKNLGEALKNAEVNLVSGADGNKLFGFDLDSKGGAGLGQMLKSFKNVSGVDLTKILGKKDKKDKKDKWDKV